MKTKYIILAIGAMLLFATGCEDALDIKQHGVSTIEDFYQTDEDAEQALTSVYFRLRANYLGMGTDPLFIKTTLSDEVWSGGGNHFDGQSYKFNDYTFEPDHSAISTLFSNYYQVIYRANLVINQIEADTPFKKQAVAEAKVIRALQYMDLILFWGTPRLVDHPLTTEEYLGGNTPTNELWAFVESDLKDAIGSGALTSKSGVSDKNVYHVTKEYAQALLGKVLVFQEKYSEAITLLQGVIDSNKYQLVSDLYNIYTPSGENTGESLFELNLLMDLNNRVTTFSWVYRGLRSGKYVNVDGSRSVGADTKLCDQTWGYANPTKSLYDKFVDVEGTDGYRRKNYIATYDELKSDFNKQIVDGEYVEDNEGFFNVKQRILDANYQSYIYPNNIRMMRLAEVYLLAAEAYFKSGNTAKATELVNAIRARAKAPVISGACTFEDIQTESQLELCFEGQRYENLLRWGLAPTVLKDKGEHSPLLYSDGHVEYSPLTYSSVHGFKTGKHELFPFPVSETSVNDQTVQNPGW